jgi:hypothetical protein
MTANNSMDVRAKQRLSYERRPLNFSGLGCGFAPRHLNRWLFRGEIRHRRHSQMLGREFCQFRRRQIHNHSFVFRRQFAMHRRTRLLRQIQIRRRISDNLRMLFS